MNNLKVTIVVMIYNNLNQVMKTLDSIKMQTYSNYEVLVSDDGSPKYSQKDFEELKKKYQSEFHSIQIIRNKENVGTVRHFNHLIKIAKGDIICPLSSGDAFYDKDALKYIVHAFLSDSSKLIFTSKRMTINNNTKKFFPNKYQIKRMNNPKKLYQYLLRYGNFISGASTYYKKEIFEKYGFFNEKYRLLEDYPFYMKLCEEHEQIGYIDHITIQYELGGISTNHKRNVLLDKDYILLFEKELNNKRIDNSIMTKRALHYRIDKLSNKYNKLLTHFLYIDVVLMFIIKKLLVEKEY